MPSERTVYEMACEAVRADATVPDDAEFLPIDQSTVQVLKSAARVDLSFKGGSPETPDYTVWFKRICLRWEVARYAPTAATR